MWAETDCSNHSDGGWDCGGSCEGVEKWQECERKRLCNHNIDPKKFKEALLQDCAIDFAASKLGFSACST